MNTQEIIQLLNDDVLETIDCISVYHVKGDLNRSLQKAYADLCEVFDKNVDDYDVLDAESCRHILEKNDPVDVVMGIRKLAFTYRDYVSQLREICSDIFPAEDAGTMTCLSLPVPDMNTHILEEKMERSGLRWKRSPDGERLILLGSKNEEFPSEAKDTKMYIHELLRIPYEVLEDIQHGVHSFREDVRSYLEMVGKFHP